jgi:hypothetical protein
VPSVTVSEIGNFLRKSIFYMIIDSLYHCKGLVFVDRHIRHVNQFLFFKKVQIWRRRSRNTLIMPRKKRAALASAENGKKSIEERPEKRVRIDRIPTSGEKEVS